MSNCAKNAFSDTLANFFFPKKFQTLAWSLALWNLVSRNFQKIFLSPRVPEMHFLTIWVEPSPLLKADRENMVLAKSYGPELFQFQKFFGKGWAKKFLLYAHPCAGGPDTLCHLDANHQWPTQSPNDVKLDVKHTILPPCGTPSHNTGLHWCSDYCTCPNCQLAQSLPDPLHCPPLS